MMVLLLQGLLEIEDYVWFIYEDFIWTTTSSLAIENNYIYICGTAIDFLGLDAKDWWIPVKPKLPIQLVFKPYGEMHENRNRSC